MVQRSRLSKAVLLALVVFGLLGASSVASAAGTSTFTGPAYVSPECSPVASGISLGLGPQQWNSSVGLPLTPTGNPLPQRIVVGEVNQTASQTAVSNLLTQCGLPAVTLINRTNPWFPGSVSPQLEATLDATVIAAALPANATITMVNSNDSAGFYGMLVGAADACGLEFDPLVDPSVHTSALHKGPSYPSGGCTISLSFGSAESFWNSQPGLQSDTDFMLDQLASLGVIVVASAGDEGSGGCISDQGSMMFGDGVARSVTAVAISNNVATLTSASHGFAVGDDVFLSAIGSPFQGLFVITSVTSNTFSFGLPFQDVPTSPVTPPGNAVVDFGGLQPQYVGTHPAVLSVGGTQWDPQNISMQYGNAVNYAPGATYQNYVWKDSSANPNCANLSGFPRTGGESTGGGQSATYPMPAYQVAAALESYPGAANFRMIPDVAALAGWPAYAISNWGMGIASKALLGTQATISGNQPTGLTVGEMITITGAGVPFDGAFTITGTPSANVIQYTTTAITVAQAALTSDVATLTTTAAHGLDVGQAIQVTGIANSTFNGWYIVTAVPSTTTFSYARTAANIVSASASGSIEVLTSYAVPNGNITQDCTSGVPPCPAADFPWFPVTGTSAAAPLTAVGIANVNAVLSARGMAPIDNGGGSMDVHSVLYDPRNSSALTDVVDGNNDLHGLGGWNALPGYDMTTGLGVPNFDTLARLIVGRNTPAPAPAPTITPTPAPSQTAAESSSGTSILAPNPPNTAQATANSSIVRLGNGISVNRRAMPGTRVTDLAGALGVSPGNAPTVTIARDRWTTVRVSGLHPNARVTSFVRSGNRWIPITSARVSRQGRYSLPPVRFSRSGSTLFRITEVNERPLFLALNAMRGE